MSEHEAEELLGLSEKRVMSRMPGAKVAGVAAMVMSLAACAAIGFTSGQQSAGAGKAFLGLSSVSSASCVTPEPVDCTLPEEAKKSLVFISSTALETPEALKTWKTLVGKLPKPTDRALDAQPLAGLKVLLLEDAGILKADFWDKASENHNNPRAMNYEKVKSSSGLNFAPSDVEAWTDGFQHLDGSFSYDNSGADGLGGIGLDDGAFTKVSIFGLCASKEQAKALFELQSKKIHPQVVMKVKDTNPCIKKFEKILYGSSIIFANGGNPDMLGFVLKKFAPQLAELIQKRVQEGTLLYMGRSAGGMVGGSDFALTYEPSPVLTTTLLGKDTTGLALAGKCALRPHIKNHLWDIPSKVYSTATGEKVILAANGEGLFCDQGCCGMTGKTELTDANAVQNAGMSATRLAKAYRQAYRSYEPDRFFDEQPEAPTCGSASAKVLLTSLGLQDASKEQFLSLVARLPLDLQSLKVVSLDDAAFLSEGFWDAANRDFAAPDQLNYLKVQSSTELGMVQEATQGFKGLRAGRAPAVDDTFLELGILPSSISHLGAFDQCASDEQKSALFTLQSQHRAPEVPMTAEDTSCVEELVSKIQEADVLVMSEGNVDFLAYVYKKFAPKLGQAIVDRVNSGEAVFLGLGAGSVLAGKSTAAAGQTGSQILTQLLKDDLSGFGLAGNCAVRPHWDSDAQWWDTTSALFEDAFRIDFVGLPDGSALICGSGSGCKLSGDAAVAKLSGADHGGLHRGRVHLAMDEAFD